MKICDNRCNSLNLSRRGGAELVCGEYSITVFVCGHCHRRGLLKRRFFALKIISFNTTRITVIHITVIFFLRTLFYFFRYIMVFTTDGHRFSQIKKIKICVNPCNLWCENQKTIIFCSTYTKLLLYLYLYIIYTTKMNSKIILRQKY